MIDDEFIHEFTSYLQWPLQMRIVTEFNRVLSPRWIRDADELRTFDMDIRQVLADNPIRQAVQAALWTPPEEVVVGSRSFEQQPTAVYDSPNRGGDGPFVGRAFNFENVQLFNFQRTIIDSMTNVRAPADERRRRQFLSGQQCDNPSQPTGGNRRTSGTGSRKRS